MITTNTSNKKHRLLTKEEAYTLITKSQMGDTSAFNKMVELNQGLVTTIAKNLLGYGLPIEDLIQEGNIGLMQAINAFDTTKDTQFSTMATNYIRTPMYNYIVKNIGPFTVRSMSNSKKVMYHLKKYAKSLNDLTPQVIETMKKDLNVSEDTIQLIAATMFYKNVEHYIGPKFDDNDGSEPLSFSENMLDEHSNIENLLIEQENDNAVLYESLDILSIDERNVIEQRWLVDDDRTPALTIMAGKYGVSAETIRQRQLRAFTKIKAYMLKKGHSKM